jgi:PleD family two-component response regulator
MRYVFFAARAKATLALQAMWSSVQTLEVVLHRIRGLCSRNDRQKDISQVMNKDSDMAPLILVVADIEETRDGIEQLLQADGYRVDATRDEEDAVRRARHAHPHLLLVALLQVFI